jgi:TonB family protein
MRLMIRVVVVASALTAGACATSTAVFVPGNGVTLPIVMNSVRPYYTQEALASRIEGSVLLNCVVRADGTVGDVEVARSLDSAHGLDTQAIHAVKQWTFQAGTKGGKPVAVRVPVDIKFTLQ